MGLEGIPALSLNIVTLLNESPGEEAREVLKSTIKLAVLTVNTMDIQAEQMQTLSRPTVVASRLRDWVAVG